VAAALGISERYVRELIRQRTIQSVTIGRARRVPSAWLDAFIERRMTVAQEEAV